MRLLSLFIIIIIIIIIIVIIITYYIIIIIIIICSDETRSDDRFFAKGAKCIFWRQGFKPTTWHGFLEQPAEMALRAERFLI